MSGSNSYEQLSDYPELPEGNQPRKQHSKRTQKSAVCIDPEAVVIETNVDQHDVADRMLPSMHHPIHLQVTPPSPCGGGGELAAAARRKSSIDLDKLIAIRRPTMARQQQEKSPYDEAHKIIWIAFFSQLGLLTRVTLAALSNMSRDSLLARLGGHFFLPNFLGCFAMGCITTAADYFSRWPSMYVGITTGFCSCCTTFASWQALTALDTLRGQVINAFVQSLVTFSCSYVAYSVGRHLANAAINAYEIYYIRDGISATGCTIVDSVALTSDGELVLNESSTNSVYRLRSFLTAVACFITMTIVFWVCAFIDRDEARRRWWIAVSFGPAGALLRYWLALGNPRFPRFPLFTLLANVAASVAIFIIYAVDSYLSSTNSSHLDAYRFWAEAGLATGSMAALSTVSTWIHELTKTFVQHGSFSAYRYGVASVLLAQGLCLITGGVYLSTGRTELLKSM